MKLIYVFSILFYLFSCLNTAGGVCDVTLTTGVFYETNHSQLEIPARYIIYRNNYQQNHVKFNITPEFVQVSDVFNTAKSLCNQLEHNSNIVAIFGGPFPTSPILQSISKSMLIPYIQTHWLPVNYYLESDFVINMYPDADLLSKGFESIIRSFHWENIMIFYQYQDVLIRLKDVIKIEKTILHKINFDNLHLSLKKARNLQISNIIIDCDMDLMKKFFEVAQVMDMLNLNYNYFFTSLDTFTLEVNCEECNLTTVALFDQTDQSFIDLVKYWERNEKKHQNFINIDHFTITTETVLFHDGLVLLIDAVNSIQECIKLPGYSCNVTTQLSVGKEIIDHMRTNFETYPIAGSPEIDGRGKRTNFTLFLYDYKEESGPIATWNSLKQEMVVSRDNEVIIQKLAKTTLQVASVLNKPYLMLKSNSEDLVGNDRFEGYCVDLLNAIAKQIGFSYEIYLVNNNIDIFSEIVNKRAHLGISDLTVTPDREEVVDFSLPFMRLGIAAMYKTLDEDTRLFKFLDPFTIDVWLSTGTLVIAQAIALYFVARMAPGDWENPHPCDQNPKRHINIWNIKNCLWLTLGSIMNQGCDILPKGISSRLVSSMWWFFALIITQSYIASLAAFLTNKPTLVIKDIDDLGRQNKLKYGMKSNSATLNFFETTNHTMYKKMYENMMSAKPSVFEETFEGALKRILTTKDGNFVFLTESTTIEYVVERICNLKMVKKTIMPRTFGIAMPRNYPLRTKINDAILNMEEKGELIALKNLWWKEKKVNLPCPDKAASDALTVQQLGGVFIILGCAVIGALILGFFEFLYAVYRVSIDSKISFIEAFKMESMFALKIWISKKRANPHLTDNNISKSPIDNDNNEN